MLPEDRLEEALKQTAIAHDDLADGHDAKPACRCAQRHLETAVKRSTETREEGDDAEVNRLVTRQTDRTAVDVLAACGNDNCERLVECLVNDWVTVDDLGYEDVFYPLRCHYVNGLVLEITGNAGTERFVYGGGDFIYRVADAERTFETAVDTLHLWKNIRQIDALTIDVTIVADEATEGDDGR